MSNKIASALLGMLASGLAAAAPVERPDILPRADGVIAYRIEGDAPGLPHAATVVFKAGGRRLRIEPDGGSQPGTLLVNRDAGRTDMLLANGRIAVRVGADPIGRYLSDPRARFARLGTDTVLDRPCTRWAMRAPEADGEGCATPDGLILRAAGHDHGGHRLALEATRVALSPQPDALFAAPAEAQSLDLSNLGRSLGLTR